MRLRVSAVPAICVFAALVSNCGNPTPVAPDNVAAQPAPPTPFAVTVTASRSELFERGQTAQLRAVVTLTNGFTEDRTSAATWSSDNSAVASVSNSGVVTAGDEGTATIAATVAALRGTLSMRVRHAFRAPDPPPGQRLPKPDVSNVVRDFFFANPALVARSCQDQGGTWEFMDGLVDRLRRIDLRWGYNGRRGDPNFIARDEVAYHYGAGASENSREAYAWDIMGGHCGPTPSPGWLDVSDLGTIWVTRGRF